METVPPQLESKWAGSTNDVAHDGVRAAKVFESLPDFFFVHRHRSGGHLLRLRATALALRVLRLRATALALRVLRLRAVALTLRALRGPPLQYNSAFYARSIG